MKRQKGSIGIVLVGILGGLILLGSILAGKYNRFVSERNTVQVSWGAVENQYQRRFDLIPNLQESVKGIFSQEQEVFKAIAEARTKYGGTAPASPERVEATNQMESALSRLLVIIENYPQLKSNEQVTKLMDELAGTENRINVARDRFNETARGYNVSVEQFPANLIAKLFGFKVYPYFESEQGAEKAPKVDLQLSK